MPNIEKHPIDYNTTASSFLGVYNEELSKIDIYFAGVGELVNEVGAYTLYITLDTLEVSHRVREDRYTFDRDILLKRVASLIKEEMSGPNQRVKDVEIELKSEEEE